MDINAVSRIDGSRYCGDWTEKTETFALVLGDHSTHVKFIGDYSVSAMGFLTRYRMVTRN